MPVAQRVGGISNIVASMRPGQTAPECLEAQEHARREIHCFNEAGADCPGMPGEVAGQRRRETAALQ